MRVQFVVAARDHHLAVLARQRRDDTTAREAGFLQLLADEAAAGRQFDLEHFRLALLDRRDRRDAAAAHERQDAVRAEQPRRHGEVDAKTLVERHVVGLLHQRHRATDTEALAELARHQVALVLLADAEEGVGVADVLLLQEVQVGRVGVQHDDALQHLAEVLGLAAVLDDDAHVDVFALQLLADLLCYARGAEHHHRARLALLLPELLLERGDRLRLAEHEHLVAGAQVVGAARHQHLARAIDGGDQHARRQLQVLQLLAGERAAFQHDEAPQLHAAFGEVVDAERLVEPHRLHHFLGGEVVERQQQVVLEVLAEEGLRPPHRRRVAQAQHRLLGAHALAEQAGQHVDLVVVRHRQQQVGLVRVGAIEHVGARTVAVHGLNVEQVGDAPHALQVRVDDGDGVPFGRQHLRQIRTDLAEPDDQDVHREGRDDTVQSPGLILLLDNKDSFVWNLAQALGALGARVDVVRSDRIDVEALAAARALVVSPGPGRPEEAGISIAAIRRWSGHRPILGVCLGHQAIGAAFGADVVRGAPVHGRTSPIRHGGIGLFAGLPDPLHACRYHSLYVAPPLGPELVATAHLDSGELMAVQHRAHPTFGVQFHPESFRTQLGQRLLANFLREVA